LSDYDLDHVFSNLVRDGAGRATMSVKGRRQRLDVSVGPNYRAMVIYAPKADGVKPPAQGQGQRHGGGGQQGASGERRGGGSRTPAQTNQ